MQINLTMIKLVNHQYVWLLLMYDCFHDIFNDDKSHYDLLLQHKIDFQQYNQQHCWK